MSEVPDIILKTTLEELRILGALETQAQQGAGFWIIVGDEIGRYCLVKDIAKVYPQMTNKQQRSVARMIKRTDLTKQVVISFHMPDGSINIEIYTVE